MARDRSDVSEVHMSFIGKAATGVQDAGILLLLITVVLPVSVLLIGAPVVLVVWLVAYLVRLS
jgi:hypothetical protein